MAAVGSPWITGFRAENQKKLEDKRREKGREKKKKSDLLEALSSQEPHQCKFWGRGSGGFTSVSAIIETALQNPCPPCQGRLRRHQRLIISLCKCSAAKNFSDQFPKTTHVNIQGCLVHLLSIVQLHHERSTTCVLHVSHSGEGVGNFS